MLQDDSISITPHPSIPSDWLNVSGSSSDVRLCQVTYQESLEHCLPIVTHSLSLARQIRHGKFTLMVFA